MPNHPLAGIPLFAELSNTELAELETALQESRYSDHQPVVWVGDAGEDFFLIRHGHVEISCPDETGKEVTLGTLGPGQFFGEISLLDGGPRTATVRARGDVVLSRLSRERFLQFLRGHPDAAVHMMTVLGRRQRETVEKVRGIRNVNEAVARQLTPWQVVSERIASVIATRWFVSLNVCVFIGWVILNLILRRRGIYLDGPHFDVMSLIVTVEALFIALFVLISQNQQSERDRIQADLDYQVNLKAHQEVMQLHQKVDRLEEVIEQLTDAGQDGLEDPQGGNDQSASQPSKSLQPGPVDVTAGRAVGNVSLQAVPLTQPAASE